MSEKSAYLEFINLVNPEGQPVNYRIASLVLNRPASANAFDQDMIKAITSELEMVRQDKHCRLLLLQGQGKHFCAGADLGWMRELGELSYQKSVEKTAEIYHMYETLSVLPIPVIGVVKGASYGGGVGLVACCDYVVAHASASFCISEVNIGLIPSIVLPYLNRKLKEGDLRRFALTGQKFDADTAREKGLVQLVASDDNLRTAVQWEVNSLLQVSGEAQKAFKGLQRHLANHSYRQENYTIEILAKVRASKEGKAGLDAFLHKKSAPWIVRLPDRAKLLI